MTRTTITLFCAALFALSCTDSVDKAAKKRIFSPEDPPQAISAATEKLPPEEVADNAHIARRILGMSAAEAVERLGAHTFTATVNFEWTNADRDVKLSESRTLVSGAGGVSGDFHGTLENSRDQGFEVMRVGTQVFAKNRYGKYRERKRDRGMAERAREQLHGVVAEFDSLFKGRMKLQPQGTATYDGRTVWKYVATLGPSPSNDDKKSNAIPALPQPKNGVDEDSRLRLQFFNQSEPKSISGEVLVDADTSVVVKARLDGTMSAPSDAGTAAVLRMSVDMAVTKIGQDPKLKPPPDFLPDQDKPKGIADALERFGIEKATDGGTSTEEPQDDDEEAPVQAPTKKK